MKTERFFRTTGVDISNPKSMFCFINDHYQYWTMNSWNGLKSIANKVKVYDLGFGGAYDCYAALNYLEADNYFTVNEMIRDWERKHQGYKVGFNGRSGGYLVLYNADNNKSVIPEELDGYDTYEDWKEDCANYGYKVSDFIYQLRKTTEIIREFDLLCDELREYVKTLADGDFPVDMMANVVEQFNDEYGDDLDKLGCGDLEMDSYGKVDISEIRDMKSLYEAFKQMCRRYKDQGYELAVDGIFARLKETY